MLVLRPEAPDIGYSGDHVIELANEMLAKASRGNFPLILDSVRGLVMFRENRQFTSATVIPCRVGAVNRLEDMPGQRGFELFN